MDNKLQLRNECVKYFKLLTLKDSLDFIDIYSNFFVKAILKHHKEPVYNQPDADAKMILHMMLTKVLHIKSILQGVSFETNEGEGLNNIIDPTIIASLVRNVYETAGLFNLIYRNTKNQDEKVILFCLWASSGLKYRQRFESVAISKESKAKVMEERKTIENYRKTIEETSLYKSLDDKNKEKIQKRIKRKEFLIRFEEKEVAVLSWQDLTNVIGDKIDHLSSMYTYFSLYSHPSNVSVFQFADMFKSGKGNFMDLANFNLKFLFIMTSIFIADYIHLFPKVQDTYDSLNPSDQIVINFYNVLIRGDDFSINESWKLIE